MVTLFAHGLFGPLSFWAYVAIWVAMTQLLIMSVTLYLHREIAHGSIKLAPFPRNVLRWWKWLSSSMTDRVWGAVHIKHHRYVDTPEDPHSPRWKKWVFPFGVYHYVVAAENPETVERYSPPDDRLTNDWLERNLFSHFPFLGVIILLGMLTLCFGLRAGGILWLIQILWIPLFAAAGINGLGHMIGYRNAETEDTSHNLIPWGFFVGGEELHNNHHLNQTSPKFSLRAWEFDMGWAVICTLRMFGMVKVSPTIGKLPVLLKTHSQIGDDTVRAFWKHRHLVMKWFINDLRAHLKKESRHSKKGMRERILRFRRSIKDGGWFAEQADYQDDEHPSLRTLSRLHEDLKSICRQRDRRVTADELKAWLERVSHEGGVRFDNFCKYVASLRLRSSLS